MKNILGSNIINQVDLFLNPNEKFRKSHVEIIKRNLKQIVHNTEIQTYSKILKDINKMQEDDLGYILIPDDIDGLAIQRELITLRNEAQNIELDQSLSNFFEHTSEYINKFYKSIEYIHSDTFIEIEGAINYLERIKYFKMKELWSTFNIYDFDFHEDRKNVIYIYSLFDKYASLILMFKYKKYNNKGNYYFKHLISDDIVDHLDLNKLFKVKTKEFIESNLYESFRNKRNDLTHNHIMPMDEYFTKLYVYIGLFLVIYFTKEIVMKYYD